MTYKQCRNCDYWVTKHDKSCPNCGVLIPIASTLSAENASDRVPVNTAAAPPLSEATRAFLGGMLGALIGAGVGGGGGVMAGVAIGVVLGVNMDLIASPSPSTAGSVTLLTSAHAPCLRRDERTIQERLETIAARERQLGEARQRVSEEEEGTTWETVRATLDRAASVLKRQRERYRVKLWEIALVRWQNAVEALTSNWESLSHDECNRRLVGLQALQTRAESFLREWTAADFADTSDARGCLDRLRQAMQSAEELRQALVIQQAVLAVRGVAPLDDVHTAPVPDTAAKHLDRIRAGAAVGEFSSAFGRLEAEYLRLQSEESLSENAHLVNRRG